MRSLCLSTFSGNTHLEPLAAKVREGALFVDPSLLAPNPHSFPTPHICLPGKGRGRSYSELRAIEDLVEEPWIDGPRQDQDCQNCRRPGPQKSRKDRSKHAKRWPNH